MIDKALFIDNTGAKNLMYQMGVVTNNLANVNTTGFHADHAVVKQDAVGNADKATRVYSNVTTTYSDFAHGPTLHTDRPLDIAIQTDGFIAVQTKDGREGYTRAGDLQISDGLLKTAKGDLVLGVAGTINVAGAQHVAIGNDGTISMNLPGDPNPVVVNRIKLTNPSVANLEKGADGLFYMAGGAAPVKQDDSVRVIPGALEGSNVNPIESLTSLVELSRQFEMQSNVMKTVEGLASKANQILEVR